MTKMEKRVAVARDVLASIKLKKYNTQARTYLTMSKIDVEEDCRVSIANLEKKNVVCNVCAIGSMFVSNIKKVNEIATYITKSGIQVTKTKGLSQDDDVMIKSLSELYSEQELRFLEFAFEGSDISDEFHDDFTLRNDAKSFYRQYSDDEERLVAIMKNIVQHKGKFVYGSTKI